jgi:uncharacterized protein YrzB (UPF0473 family)
MQNGSFEITDENGKKISCEILMSFEDNQNKYMIYTDGELDDEGNIEVLATKYTVENDKVTLIPIEDDAEWDLVDKKWSESNE